ncbi:MAG TPA: hypothetical protein VNG53_07280 [Bacteroidia bacterium]|nr:hypothetical protein [Bacteroidia bacterium]
MKKIAIIALLAMPFLHSCKSGNDGTNPVVDSLNTVNRTLQSEANQQDSINKAFVNSFNVIEDNLDQIKEKEKIVTLNSQNGETAKSKQDEIVDEIKAINELMIKNKREIYYLRKKLKGETGKNAQLEEMIDHLTKQLAEKDDEINSLKDQLTKANTSLTDLMKQFTDSVTEIQTQKAEINTAYYAFGTAKELKKQGIIVKSGGIIGIGGTETLKSDFNKNYFTKIDITKNTDIPMYAKIEQVVTIHPSGSYKISGNDKVDTLKILDYKSFWSASKYLVVIVKQKH